MSRYPISIWWVRSDLRLEDNPALSAATRESEVVIPVFGAIHAASSCEAMIAPADTARMLSKFSGASRSAPVIVSPPLTDREEEVVLALAKGRSNTEIAEALFISTATVETHVAHLKAKIGSRNRVEMAIWVHESGRI